MRRATALPGRPERARDGRVDLPNQPDLEIAIDQRERLHVLPFVAGLPRRSLLF